MWHPHSGILRKTVYLISLVQTVNFTRIFDSWQTNDSSSLSPCPISRCAHLSRNLVLGFRWLVTAVSCSRKGEPRKKGGREEEEERSVVFSIANVYGFQQPLSEPKGITNWSLIVLVSQTSILSINQWTPLSIVCRLNKPSGMLYEPEKSL